MSSSKSPNVRKEVGGVDHDGGVDDEAPPRVRALPAVPALPGVERLHRLPLLGVGVNPRPDIYI